MSCFGVESFDSKTSIFGVRSFDTSVSRFRLEVCWILPRKFLAAMRRINPGNCRLEAQHT